MSVIGRENYNIYDGCFDLMDQGVDQNGLIAYLHDEGATVIEAVLIMMKLNGLRMGKAGTAIAIHPSWQTDIQAYATQSDAAAEWVREWRDRLCVRT